MGRKREEARWTGAKGAVKRSVVVDARGIPLGTITAPANRHDSPLLEATLDTLKPLGELPDRASVQSELGLRLGHHSLWTGRSLVGR